MRAVWTLVSLAALIAVVVGVMREAGPLTGVAVGSGAVWLLTCDIRIGWLSELIKGRK